MVFSLNHIQLNQKACLNYLSNLLVCSNCIDVCPTDAINLNNRIPEINHNACINCGVCVSSCDTLAIDHIQKPYITTSKHVAEYPNSNISCDKLEEYQMGVKIPCYLYLDLSLILQASGGRDFVNLYVKQCHSCDKVDYLYIKNHVYKLQKELEGLNIPLEIMLIESDIENRQEDQTIDALSRREFFQRLSLKKLREQFFKKESEYADPSDDPKSLVIKTKFKRQLFNDYCEKHFDAAKRKQTKLPFNKFKMLEISDSCIGCNICNRICPTRAISWQEQFNESILIFSTQDCIGCKKCLVCPEDSISFTEISIEDYIKQKNINLKSFSVKSCKECGDQFKSNNDQELCRYCEEKQHRESFRFFIP